ncbi:insulin-like growth factor-binding protein-related protein 1 [Ischnura elegans]|uniref:insulin-like growth factor-binding protein-related protein 1 n=1 Tax=Ischnura elegans TaxID=197161 RepID=UPI001ED897FD|nr:insulin-like growth factor-binding protein-related protein 1 [Ischnura elegans]
MKVLAVLAVGSLLFLGLAAADEDFECGVCDPESCPSIGDPQRECPAGVAIDTCGCCRVCARTVGEKCYTPSLPKTSRKYGYCGDNLECLIRSDLERRDEPEAICFCKEKGDVCASNNHTYETICHMAKASSSIKDTLYMRHKGPCHTVPIITSAPDDSTGVIGQPIALSCEVKGHPIPDIHWEFKSDDDRFSTIGKNLPSDDLYVAVQVRGGPEAYMTTSWVQIVDLRPTDVGVYTCVAINSEGVARASAKVRAHR